jgi:diguanylate cyclase (GGDEF)-like protein
MFNLGRYFSKLSFLLVGLCSGLLIYYFHHVSVAQLVHHEQARSEAITRGLENSFGSDFRFVLNDADKMSINDLQERASRSHLREALTTRLRDTTVLKIKLITLQGLTAFSTDLKQIGQDQSGDKGYVSAREGAVTSELTHHEQFDAIDGALINREVLSTFIPIYNRLEDQKRIEGVIEVFLDATELVQGLNQMLTRVVLLILGVVSTLFLVQFLAMRRTHVVLREQAKALESVNLNLDRRVHERTHELHQEINERRQTERRMDHLAMHDPLTALPNRLHIRQHLSRSLKRMAETNRPLGILFLGLDHFKEVNETLGHAVGDELLVAVTRRLQSQMRPGDALARLGSDEFFCVLENIQDAAAICAEAEKMLALFHQPFAVDNNLLYLSASIGISQAPADGDETALLVRNANAALYKAKALGRNRFHFYTPEMTQASQERLHLAGLLRQSIAGNELSVNYQPKVNPLNGQLCGAEALLRWTNAEVGSVSPARFIPLAEDIGFIVEIGTWVLREACRQMVAWDDAGFQVSRMAVNLSVKQLARDNFTQVLRDILDETGLAADRLELEITESVIMEVDNAYAILGELRELGVHFAIDDFGTGYSSLAYLKKLPVQTLKIDRAFVIGIGQSASDEAIIEAIMKIATSLGLLTVAEGVETDAQLAFLRGMGCDQIQGYFYSKPVQSHDFFDNWFYRQPRLATSSVRQFPTQRSARS